MRKFHLLSFVFALILSGCAHYQWVHPNKTKTQFHQDKYICKVESAKIYPQKFKTVTQFGREKTVTTTCLTPRSCKQVESNSGELVDVNRRARGDLFDQCMQAKGWILERTE